MTTITLRVGKIPTHLTTPSERRTGEIELAHRRVRDPQSPQSGRAGEGPPWDPSKAIRRRRPTTSRRSIDHSSCRRPRAPARRPGSAHGRVVRVLPGRLPRVRAPRPSSPPVGRRSRVDRGDDRPAGRGAGGRRLVRLDADVRRHAGVLEGRVHETADAYRRAPMPVSTCSPTASRDRRPRAGPRSRHARFAPSGLRPPSARQTPAPPETLVAVGR